MTNETPDSNTVPRRPPTAAELGAELEETVNEFLLAQIEEMRAALGLVNQEKLMQLSGQMLGVECRECHWIALGGSRYVFALVMSNGVDVIARVCRPDKHLSSPPLDEDDVREIILSEVANLKYLSTHTTVPVPKVLGYDARRLWSRFRLHLTGEGQVRFIEQRVGYNAQMIKQRFPMLGSLYEDVTSREIGVEAWGPAAPSFKYSPRGRRGPFDSVVDWFKVQALSQIERLDALRQDTDRRSPPSSHRAAMKSWYMSLHDALGELKHLRQRAGCHFVLLHEDFQLGNILTSYDAPSQVVGILDWEGARWAPLWAAVPIQQGLDLYMFPMERRENLSALVNSILIAAVLGAEPAMTEDRCLRVLWALMSDHVADHVQSLRRLQVMRDRWPVEEDLVILRLTEAQEQLLPK